MASASSKVAPPSFDSGWDREAKALGRVPLFLAAALLAIVGFVVVAGGQDDEPAAEGSSPAESPTRQDAEEASDPPPGEAVAEAEPAPREPAQILAASASPPEPGLQAELTTVGREPKRRGRRPAKKTKSPPSRKTKPPAPTKPRDPEVEIKAARMAGWMLESGSLLLIFPKKTPMAWDRAKSLCRRRRDAGLTRWRLARFGELKELRASRSLPAGTWWSSTAGQDDTQALTLAPTEAKAINKTEAKALPICVHPRPSWSGPSKTDPRGASLR